MDVLNSRTSFSRLPVVYLTTGETAGFIAPVCLADIPWNLDGVPRAGERLL